MKSNNITGKSDIFSFSRFAAYFRLYLESSKRKLLLGAGQIFIIFFIFSIFIFYQSDMNYESLRKMNMMVDFDPFWGAEMEMVTVFTFVFSAIAGSWMFSAVSSKRSRLNTFEIPASQFEKFLTWWLIYLPIYIVVMFVSFYLGDILRVVWIKIGTDYGDFAHVIPLGNLLTFTPPGLPGAESFDSSAIVTLMSYCTLVGLNAFFALGGIFFHRLNFLKTMACGFVGLIIISIVCSAGYKVFFANLTGGVTSRLMLNPDKSTAIVVTAVVTGVICLCLYLLSYARYKETEIVNRW